MRLNRVVAIVLLGGLALLLPVPAQAQDDGVMNSAETINRGNFKLMAYPMVIFGEGEADNANGVTLRGGYGFTSNLDVEAKLTFYDDITFFGADVEFWAVRAPPVDVSIGGGFHFGWGDNDIDVNGIDITALASGHVTSRLEIYSALDLAINSLGRNGFDNDFTTVHLVPGIEYAVSDTIDLLAEFGIGLDDDSSNYISGGIAFYFR